MFHKFFFYLSTFHSSYLILTPLKTYTNFYSVYPDVLITNFEQDRYNVLYNVLFIYIIDIMLLILTHFAILTNCY